MKVQLKELHQKARLARDPIGTEAYGAAVAAIQESEVRANADFDEAKQITVVEKEAGRFLESSEAFAKVGRDEKASELKQCADLLTALLPTKLDSSAYPEMIAKAISETGASGIKEMGKVMAALKNEHGAALDMKIASAQVKAAFG